MLDIARKTKGLEAGKAIRPESLRLENLSNFEPSSLTASRLPGIL
jgi:hypothetical protein